MARESSRRSQSAPVWPNVTVKAFSSLFVATELSSLLRSQNADSKGQLPLQRQSSKQMLFWIWVPEGGGVSVTGCPSCTFHPIPGLPSLQAQKPPLSPDWSPYTPRGLWGPQTRQIWRVSLMPRLCSLSSYVLVWAMTFFPRYIRRSAIAERQLSEASWCQRCWKSTSPWQPQGYFTQQHSDVTDHRAIIFFDEEEALAQSTEPRGFCLFCLFVFMLYPSLQSFWHNVTRLGSILYIDSILPHASAHRDRFATKIRRLLLGRRAIIHLCSSHCLLPKGCFHVLISEFLFPHSRSRVWPTWHLMWFVHGKPRCLGRAWK